MDELITVSCTGTSAKCLSITPALHSPIFFAQGQRRITKNFILAPRQICKSSDPIATPHHILCHHIFVKTTASLQNLKRKPPTMHLMYTLDASGNRLYTLKKVAHGQVTKSAHPARFSPDDKWSRQRVTLKRRFTLLLTQQSE